MRQEGPSVEDILQSIKRVMERDDQEALHQQASPDDHSPEPTDEDEAEELLGSSRGQSEPTADGAPRAHISSNSPGDNAKSARQDPDALTSQDAGAAMRRSLAAPELLTPPGDGGAGHDDAALNAAVDDMLRPMLAEWLETHLPAIVDRHVRAEIARITGGKG